MFLKWTMYCRRIGKRSILSGGDVKNRSLREAKHLLMFPGRSVTIWEKEEKDIKSEKIKWDKQMSLGLCLGRVGRIRVSRKL